MYFLKKQQCPWAWTFLFKQQTLVSEKQKQLFQKIRIVPLLLVSCLVLFFDFFNINFLIPSLSVPLYTALSLLFAVNAVFVFFDNLWKSSLSHQFLLLLDTVFISFLLYQTNLGLPSLLILYFFNILLGAFLFEKKDVFLLAAWQSFALTCVVASLEVFSRNTYLLLITNQFAFFIFGFLSLQFLNRSELFKTALEEQFLKVQTLLDFNRVIVENSLLGFMALDEKGRVIFMNKRAQKGWNFFDKGMFFHKEWPEVWDHISEAKQGIKEFKRKGSVFEVHWNEFAEKANEQKGFILIFEDRTELKLLENSIKQKEKMAAIGQLSAGLAHEIRNPLASISGSLQMLSQLDLEDSYQKLLLIVLREFDRLNDLVSEFLEFSRYEKGEEELIDIAKLIREAIHLVSEDIRQPVVHELEFNSDRKFVGHFDKLKQALLNILLNAYQAMEHVKSPCLEVSSYDEGGKIVLKIKDNGCGMSEEVLENLFNPFYTTKQKGTGLGMAICHKILISHGVEILVKSKENEGSTFYLSFQEAAVEKEKGEHLG